LYGTRYWNGSGSTQNCRGQLIVEEYVSAGLPPISGSKSITIG
jgi:hypothetical protein